MVDKLANEYAAAGKPVVFLEQNKQYTGWRGGRIRLNRFLAASAGKSGYPGVMVDSGNKWTYGAKKDYYNTYKALVEAELARAPQAEVSATAWRVGNHLEFEVGVKNLSEVTLSQVDNDATVTVIVYEDVVPNSAATSDTSRIDCAVAYINLVTPLEVNAFATYSLKTADLVGVNWAKLHSIAFVDYRPDLTKGPYDMLQAAAAAAPVFDVQPGSLTFQVDQAHPGDPEAPLQLTGSPSGLGWTVTSKPSWLTVTPASGGLSDAAVVKVAASALQPGANNGTIRFTTSTAGITLTQDVKVQATYIPPPSLAVEPQAINLIVDPDDPEDPQVPLKISGYPTNLAWTIAAKPAWLVVTPAAGVVGDQPVASIDASALHSGANSGTIRFSANASGVPLTAEIAVRVVYDDRMPFYIPLIER